MNINQRYILFVLVSVTLLWVSYQLSFSKTLEIRKHYSTLKKEAQLYEGSNQKLLTLQKESLYYDSILVSKRISTKKSFQNNLLSIINAYADSTELNVKSFQQPHIIQHDNAKIITYIFTLQGGFNQLTSLIFQLEQELKLGKIISVNFNKKKDYKYNTTSLECTLLLQRIESN